MATDTAQRLSKSGSYSRHPVLLPSPYPARQRDEPANIGISRIRLDPKSGLQ
jgi:hypothetical protein